MKMGRRRSGSRRIGYVSIETRSLLAPCRRPILIATKYLLFRGQDTSNDAFFQRCCPAAVSHLPMEWILRSIDWLAA
jgi:hypothetical protein